MSNKTKSFVSGIVCVVCAALMVYCAMKMVVYGLGGDAHMLKLYAVPFFGLALISVPFGVAYDYYRWNKGDTALDRARVETEALSHIGKKRSK